jgi:ribulose-5-phosphate 4-epimerase/fuculose-1-phosphate aldolase
LTAKKDLVSCVKDLYYSGLTTSVSGNHGVVAAGMTIHHARAVAESLEEWSKILAISMSLGGAKYFLGEP